MIRRMMFVFIIILTTNFLLAQGNGFEIKGTESNIYLDHTIAAKETFYSVGRMYNVSAKELASFNQTTLAIPLKIGEVLKVPLTKTNFTQSGKGVNGGKTVPVYHTMESGETLYRLGVNYNKVPVSSLKEWNHLQSDDVSVGTRMIVGFLKSDNASAAVVNSDATPKESKTAESSTGAIVAAIPAVGAAAPQVAKNASADKPAASEIAAPNVSAKPDPGFYGGYFKNLYNQQTANKSLVDKNGQASVFKSTSGWQDGKYYCFNNDAAAGTVLKITNTATGKSVYAKVLDAIPAIKQNEDLAVILSNAAATELGGGESNFSCVVSFGK